MTPLEIALRVQDVLAFYVVQPIIIMMLGVFVGKVLEQVIIFLGREFAPKRTRVRVLAVMASTLTYIASAAIALHSIGILGMSAAVVGSVIFVIVSLHLILSGRDFLSNYIHFRTIQKKVPVGATIGTTYGSGAVVAVQLAETHLKLKNGDDLYIPNKTMRALKIDIEKKA